MLEGVPPEGDCVSPRTVTVTLFEDRLGNHVGVLCNAEGKELRRFTVTQRLGPEIRRVGFSDPLTMANLEYALREVEECR